MYTNNSNKMKSQESAVLRNRIVTMKNLLLLAFSMILYSFSQSAVLDTQEVVLLAQIWGKLGLQLWDFDCNQWNEETLVTCEYCSFQSNIPCHVTHIRIAGEYVSAPLPYEFAKLPYLQSLHITYNYLTGNIPSEWATLRLTNLYLRENMLSGPFPTALTRMTTLLYLDIGGNRFSGSLPEEIGKMKNLCILDISSNDFTGRLPFGLRKLTNLTDIWISDNNFVGKIPSFISRWTQIQTLHMQGCSLEGPIPSSISTLIQLSDLRISDLKSGSSTFPSLEKMTKLSKLVLRNCLLNGTFPNYFGDMIYLRILDLSFNKLSGKIPSTYSLRYIYLTKNNLSGPLPRWILSSTKNVDVSYNHFTWNASAPKKCPQGTINLIGSYSSSTDNHVDPCLRKNFPCTKSKAQQIYSLHINCGGEEVYINNTIKFDDDTEGKGASSYYNHGNWAFSNTGNFMDYEADSDPYTISNTSDLQNISTYDTELYITARATAISLTYYGLCLMNGNYKVKLHFAEIAFTQHNSSNILGKRVFDIYVQGILRVKNFDIVKEAGGIGRAVIKSYSIIVENNTLEIQLYWAGKGTTSIPYAGSYGPIISAISVEPNFKPPKFGKKNKVGLVAGTTVGGVFALILLFVVLWRKGYITGRNSQQDLIGTDLQTGIFTWKQIKDATKNFDPSNKLGEGGFGAVYKGKLSDGTLIAVKLPSPNSKQGINEFLREIGTLAMLKHENLVKLYGFSINRTKYALIYEYMENNSLSHALFGSDEEIKKKLTWQVRLKICKDIARGLAYLHENDITHRDIKPSNVLLDRNFNAKISDFGLAELIDEENTNVNNCAGTMAYMAPEYAMRGILSTKVDVYSFGIVAIEIVSGKRIDCTLVEEDCYNLIEMATTLVNEGNILKLVDPDLRSDYSKKEASIIINTGVLCTHNRPDLRPNMSEATDMLEGRKDAERLLKRNPMNHSNTRARNHAWNEPSVSNRVVVDETYTNSTVANARAGNHAWSEPSVSIRVVDETNTESAVANTNNDGPNSLKILLAFMVVAGGIVSRVQGR